MGKDTRTSICQEVGPDLAHGQLLFRHRTGQSPCTDQDALLANVLVCFSASETAISTMQGDQISDQTAAESQPDH